LDHNSIISVSEAQETAKLRVILVIRNIELARKDQELKCLEKKHKQELDEKDAEIVKLKKQVCRLKKSFACSVDK